MDRDQDSHTASNLGAFASSWLAALRFTSDAKAPTPAGPAISTKDVGRIFFFGNKAQRKRAMLEKMMLFAAFVHLGSNRALGPRLKGCAKKSRPEGRQRRDSRRVAGNQG